MSRPAVAGSVASALGSAVDALAAAGVESPRLDAELLLERATGHDRARLVANPEAGVEAGAAREFGAMVRRRLRREPIAYILGSKGFRRIELEVDRRVLIPRPESELLVELALELEPATVLDVGTGSGAIALAIANELPGPAIVATDTSLDALAVAKANRDRLGLTDVEAVLELVARALAQHRGEALRLLGRRRRHQGRQARLRDRRGVATDVVTVPAEHVEQVPDALGPAVDVARVGVLRDESQGPLLAASPHHDGRTAALERAGEVRRALDAVVAARERRRDSPPACPDPAHRARRAAAR